MEEIDVKDKIVKGAEELFMRYGVRSVSMDDIARQLGISKKTLYLHFADKEELISVVSHTHMNRDREEFEQVRKDSKNSIEELARLSVCMRKNMEELNPSLLFDLQKFHPKAWSYWVDFKNKYIKETVIRNLKQGIEEGYYRPEINPEILATMRIELVQIAFDPELFPKGKYKLADVQMQIFEHFVYGVLTDKGRKLFAKYKKQNENH